MQALQTEIPYQGRLLKQLKREGLVALYQVLSKGDVSYGYEVIIIKVAPAKEIFGKPYPERELYPSSSLHSNDWGTVAWSYGRNYLEDALERYHGLCREQREGRLKVAPASDLNDLDAQQ